MRKIIRLAVATCVLAALASTIAQAQVAKEGHMMSNSHDKKKAR